jgi:hypothetical protein
MAVACAALFVSLGGTSVAAISYARNAGAVDGRSAVKASSTLKHAAGKLVATAKSGPNKGRIPSKFLASGSTRPDAFGSYGPVTDNATGSPTALASIAGVGDLSASCADQSNKPGVEDPITRLMFNNTSGTAINFARQVGGNNAEVIAQLPGTVQTFQIPGANTFTLHAQRGLTNLLVEGVVRQDGANTADAKCLVYGVAFRVTS